MRIGILGGSFDPPHVGHLIVARQTRETVGLDEVWLMPYFEHNWDPTVSPVSDRLAMTKLVEEKGIITSEEEIGRSEKSYTIDTMRRLKQKYPSHEFFWIIGSDTLSEFQRWKDPENLAREITFLVFPRNGYPLSKGLPRGFLPVSGADLVTTNISSTIVRNRITKGRSVVGLVASSVLDYIKKHSLYVG